MRLLIRALICCMVMPAYADDLTAAQISCSSWSKVSAVWPVLHHEQGVLLYLWSPRMALSVQHAAQVRAVAQSLDLHWQPVHDPRIPSGEIHSSLQAPAVSLHARQTLATSAPLCDADLLAQGQTLRHFPIAWVYQQDSQLVWRQTGLPIVSAMPAMFWHSALLERVKSQDRKNR